MINIDILLAFRVFPLYYYFTNNVTFFHMFITNLNLDGLSVMREKKRVEEVNFKRGKVDLE